MNDVHDRLKVQVEELAESNGIPVDMARRQVETMIGMDLADIEDDDAETFADAMDENDFETACNVLEAYDVPEDVIEQFRQTLETAAGDTGNDEPVESEPVEDTESDSTDDGDIEAIVERKLDEKMPSSDDIARSLRKQMGADGSSAGGGGNQQQPPQDAGASMQQQMALRLAEQWLTNDSGGGAAAALGEKVQEAAMESFIRDLQKPDFGDLLEAQFYKRALDSEAFEDMYGEMMNGDVFGMDSDDDDESDYKVTPDL